MYGILQVNTLPSGNIMAFVQSCNKNSWKFYKCGTNAFNVHVSVSIESKVYTY